jgi:hypothetical protein
MNKIRTFIRNLFYIVDTYGTTIRHLRQQVESLEDIIKERTTLNVDIGFKGANHVIVVGKFKGQDYIQTYDVGTEDLGQFVNILQRMAQHGTINKVDAPPQMRGGFKRDLFRL